eukprot:SAG31_NODE_1389_length_8545_cov_3.081103_6_plen_146_part_00
MSNAHRYVELLTKEERKLRGTALSNYALAVIKLVEQAPTIDSRRTRLKDAWLSCVEVVEINKLLNCLDMSLVEKAYKRKSDIEWLLVRHADGSKIPSRDLYSDFHALVHAAQAGDETVPWRFFDFVITYCFSKNWGAGVPGEIAF